MSSDALSIARKLITELNELEMAGLDDAGPTSLREEKEVRLHMVSTLLAHEAKITDLASIVLVEGALPRVIPGETVPMVEYEKLAEFLHRHIL